VTNEEFLRLPVNVTGKVGANEEGTKFIFLLVGEGTVENSGYRYARKFHCSTSVFPAGVEIPSSETNVKDILEIVEIY